MSERDVTTGEILEFLKEHMVMKADLDVALARMASKEDLQQAKTEIMTHIDGLAARHNAFDQELLMIQNRQDRLEEKLV